MVDKVRIQIKAGDGGDGCVSFHREKYVPAGGPDGGDGGRGGDVCFVAKEGLRSLMDFTQKSHFKAPNGQAGSGGNCSGKSAESLVIAVPVGTVVYDEQTGAVMANMTVPNEIKTVLRGGRGGRGNARFATATRKAPRFAQPGQRTQARWIRMELKSVADVGLVGFPNVGKSTLLKAVTRANPKIADYHFTTLSPNLGVFFLDNRGYTMADIPGLIEGASQGQGLGHEFLRHVERTRVLVHVIDASALEGRDVVEDYLTIQAELSQYSSVLGERPVVVAANKADLPDAAPNTAKLEAYLKDKGVEVYAISAATGKGLTPLLRAVAKLVDAQPPVVLEEETFDESMLFTEKTFAIEQVSEGVFEVGGSLVEEILRRVYPQDRDSMRWFGEQLETQGIVQALRDKGAKDGDTVFLGDIEFDFVE